MRKTRILLVAWTQCVLVVLSLSASNSKLEPIARRITDGKPVWVSEKAAFTADGEFRDELFSIQQRAMLDDLRKKNGSKCSLFTDFPALAIHAPSGSLEALAMHASRVVTGRVVAAEQGFYQEKPGTVFTMSVSWNLKVAEPRGSDTARLFVSVARIDSGRGMLCAMPPLNAVVPKVGDDVLFFAHLEPTDVENKIYIVEPHRHILVETEGRLILPKRLQSEDSPRNLDDAIRRVAAGLAAEKLRKVR
ncbi:MAG TPA: hypothetical protein VF883_05530 [Thermoanaerobaculia bacterium]|jgi:hypothetical protein